VSRRTLQKAPLESSCGVVTHTAHNSTSESLKISPEKSQILSCDTVVANERYEVLLYCSLLPHVSAVHIGHYQGGGLLYFTPTACKDRPLPFSLHQELETILVLLPHTVCNAFVAGGRRSGAGQQAMRPG